MNRASTFAAVYATLTAAHEVADHWVQTDDQAAAKGSPGPVGAKACARHVVSYTATQAAALAAVAGTTGLRLSWRRAAAVLAVSAVTHYAADRQAGHWADKHPRGVVRLAGLTGSSRWVQRDPNAPYLLDQAWHKGWIMAAALVAAGTEEA